MRRTRDEGRPGVTTPSVPRAAADERPSDGVRNLRTAATRLVWSLLVWGIFAFFILGPLLTVLAFSFTPAVFEGVRLSTLHWYQRLFSQPDLFQPLLRSFQVATIVVLIQLVIGTLVAYATVRRRIFAASALDALSNLTIALPSVVVGLALLSFYGPFGPIRALTDLFFGDPLSFTWTLWIVVFAHVLETFPYMVRTVATALQQLPPNLESAARSLGASRFTVFRTVVLPLLKPSLLAGGVLVFSRSVAEFGATIVVVSAVLRTAPIKIYAEAEAGNLELAAAYSVVLMLVSFSIYLVLRRRLLKDSDSRLME
ncbi:MAG TPA: ABC transporter permease [Candidatus Thermoplasmatota archaeon]|nr:ABC transporter permease [Candidatus Thermoplasmatota archaeon]